MKRLKFVLAATIATAMFASTAGAVKLAQAPKKSPAGNAKGSNPGFTNGKGSNAPGIGNGKGSNQQGYKVGRPLNPPKGYSTGAQQPSKGYKTGAPTQGSQGGAAAPSGGGNSIGQSKAEQEAIAAGVVKK